MRYPVIWDFAYLSPAKIEELSRMARPERWKSSTDESINDYPILNSYIDHTFRRLATLDNSNPQSNYIYKSDKMISFNTGLFTTNFESIYAIFRPNSQRNSHLKWELSGFYTESSLELKSIPTLPARAKYFNKIEEIIYNTNYDLRIQYDHILDDPKNIDRIPNQYRTQINANLPMLFRAAAHYAKIRIEENYKTAVPQFYNGRVQFLIPISLSDPAVVDLALAVNREEETYSGRTCLTLDMAYNNARLIARPDTDWLK